MSRERRMNLRRATMFDVPALADIGFKTWFIEPIEAHWYPLKEKYPHDYYRALIDDFTVILLTPGSVIMVVEVEDEDVTEEATPKEIIAFMNISKHGPLPEDLVDWNPNTPVNKLQRSFLEMHNSLLPNRAVSTETIRNYYSQTDKIYAQDMGDLPENQRWLHCRYLAVHPDNQRRGCGEKLLEWAGIAAATENVPIFCDSTSIAVPLYLQHGARKIGKIYLPARVVDAGPGSEPVKLDAMEVDVLKWKFEWRPEASLAKRTKSHL